MQGNAVYRFANTADAMWGYRGPWEWAGKWAARADDLLSWIPARLTGLAMIATRPGLLPRLLREAALDLVRAGETTLQEINRVTFV